MSSIYTYAKTLSASSLSLIGGKPGSVWTVNSLNVLVAVQGLNPPEISASGNSNSDTFYDLAYQRFFCTPDDLIAGNKALAAAADK